MRQYDSMSDIYPEDALGIRSVSWCYLPPFTPGIYFNNRNYLQFGNRYVIIYKVCVGCSYLHIPLDQRKLSHITVEVRLWAHVRRTHVYSYMFVSVNFDALVTGKRFRIEMRQVVFLCWMQDSNPGLLEPDIWKLECPWKTEWVIEDQATGTWHQ